MQASQLYPLSAAANTQAHQLWAACTLYQATGQSRFWAMTTALYANAGFPAGGNRLFWPVANYDNPLWFGVMCMAQSGRSFTGLEFDAGLELEADDGRTPEEILAATAPAPASRLDALNQLWSQLLAMWVGYGSGTSPVTCGPPLAAVCAKPSQLRPCHSRKESSDQFLHIGFPPASCSATWRCIDQARAHFLKPRLHTIGTLINTTIEIACRLSPSGSLRHVPDLGKGLFRDVSNVAMLALMYADLPAVTEQRAQWARCLAKQSVDYILGDNPAALSYLVGFGCALPTVRKCPKTRLSGQTCSLCSIAGPVGLASATWPGPSASSPCHRSVSIFCDFLPSSPPSTLLSSLNGWADIDQYRANIQIFQLCRDAFPQNPYSKDAACPDDETLAERFSPVVTLQGIRSREDPRVCDYLSFLGNPSPDDNAPGGVIDPVLPNTHELTGALVSTMAEASETYTDVRSLPNGEANPQAAVALDYNAGALSPRSR